MRASALATMLVVLSASVWTSGCNEAPKVDPAEAQAKLTADLKAAAAWTRNHKHKDAEKLYNQILSAHPDQPEALAGLARIKFADGANDEAIAMVDKSIAAKGDDATTHALRGEILARQEKHLEAAGAFGKAFELAPEKSEYGLPHGVQLRLANKLEDSEKVLRAVAELDPMAQFVYTELGDVLRAQNRSDEALKTYMKALSTYASDKMAHAGAAQIYEAKGDIDHALNEWSTYVRMDCCSKYSTDVAKKKIVELQAASNARDAAAPPPTDAPADPPPAEPVKPG
jgi:tetratricopeptide (TPR) repeat protein